MAEEGGGQKLTLSIKPTAQQNAKYTVCIEPSAPILDLKEAVHQAMGASGYAPAEQRLIYKGQILKDERTVESYGIGNEHVLHLVRGRPQGSDSSSSGGQGAATTTGTAAAPAGGLGGIGGAGGLGADPFNGMGMGGMPSPEAMQAMMSSPMMQGLMNNPDMLRGMLQSNPMVQQLMERHPELAGVLNDPAVLRQSMQIASNPSLMREHMRHTDRALSNIEAMPEGFNALRRMFESVQEPLMNATSGPDALANHPFAALMGGAAAGGGANTAATAATGAGVGAAGAAASPNASPLPNPWAPAGAAGGGGGAAAGGAAPAGLGGAGLGGLGGLGAFPGGMGGLGGLGGAQPNPQEVVQMMQNPAVRQMMVSLMSQPGFVDQMAAMHPMLRQMLDANPSLRSTLSDPNVIETMTRPEALQAASAMQQAMGGGGAAAGANPLLQQLMGGAGGAGNTAGLANLAALLGQGGLGGAGGAGGLGGPGAGGAGGMDFGALLGALGGLGLNQGGAGGPMFGAPPAVADPETAFASQLTALADMGFTDRAANVRALQATGGNVHAAVDRLLSGI